MIITKLMGGLGNQMFQYAIGRHVSIKNNTDLKLDISFYDNIGNNTPREYSLGNFNIIENFLSKKELKKTKRNNFHGHSFAHRILRKIFIKIESKKPLTKKTYITETNPSFQKDVLNIQTKKDLYLYGNWQSEKYFKDIRETILKDFSLKNKMSENAENSLTQIKNSNSISIHIRRGDYVNNKEITAYHGICALEYYNQAIKLIEKEITNPTYFVFSDDIDWVKENLKTNHKLIFISGNDIPDYEELTLMSYCKHNIIANSSFSWWGAWLNKNENKKIIAPRKWYNVDRNIEDLCPNNWIKI